jgi:hypothetical protein
LSIYEEKARMKLGSHLFAILAIGALSTQVAAAGHHGPRSGAAADHSRTAVVNNPAKTGAASDTTPNTAPAAAHSAVTPALGTVGKNGGAGIDDIDTSITVHQGHEPIKGGGKGRPVSPR